ncbi:uncharacterized protein DNG_07892 [Cephalotrichum gorgonifer]|uniref:ubiquitinyl hydrolase 1 n=1 Tax=Cephalotrichum gorgonifer TaxID=2041049 RepID=A0AAE8SXV7_9PEZI|nr:uncharacterized protein DNG_07892 [Cephalotrichum gorgonifer]
MSIRSLVDAPPGGQDEINETPWGFETPRGFFSRPYVRTTPLFIHDLFDHNLWEWKEFMAIKASDSTFASEYDGDPIRSILTNRVMPSVPPTTHTMILSPSQTGVSEDGTKTVSAVCLHCLYHISLRVPVSKGHAQCKLRAPLGGVANADGVNGPHQLYLLSSGPSGNTEGDDDDNAKYNPPAVRATYACISDECGLRVEVAVSPPRLDAKWVKMLTDEDRIKSRLEALQTTHPDRFNIGPNEWHTLGLPQLMTYLKDLLEAADQGREPRSLSKRNKRFEAIMGPPFYDLFRFLEYKEFTKGEGSDEEHFFLQSLPDASKGVTELGSRRAFFEDVALEVRLHGERLRFCSRDRTATPNLEEVGKSLAKREFQQTLDCYPYPNVSTNGSLTYHLRFLGVMPDFQSKLVENACARLSKFLPDLKATFEDSLYSVARDTSGQLGQNSEFLRRVKGVVGEDTDDMFNETWGLAPGNIRRTDDEVIAAVRKKLRDGPESIDLVFEILPVYAKSRGSKRLTGLTEWLPVQMPMPVDLAYDVLGARSNDSPKQLALNAEERAKRAKPAIVANALRSVARHRESRPLLHHAEMLERGPVTNPVGLENIGNTCYLNSILQYLYTVQPIRTLVETYAENRLDSVDMDKRRIGGSKSKVQAVDLVIGQHFTGEALNALFHHMTTAPRGPCAPSQALANAVLLSSEQLLRLSKEETNPEVNLGMFPLPASTTAVQAPQGSPPPLPARPTPILRLRPSVDGPTDAAASVSGDSGSQSYASSPTLMGDAASDRSYKMDDWKLDSVDATGDTAGFAQEEDVDMVHSTDAAPALNEDVEMTDGETAASDEDLAERPETDAESLLQTLKIKHELTMSQQDVDEMMGRVMGLMQASIKPTSTEGDIQTEVILQTFFFRVIMHTVSFTTGESPQRQDTRTAEFFRNLTAYPAPDGPCTLYQALDNNFDKEEIEGTTISRYSAVESLPPILHVLVQRTKGDGTKNPNPVVIDEYLQLDRYMDAPEGSDLMYLRETSWALKKRRAELTEQENLLSSMDSTPLPSTNTQEGQHNTDDRQFVMIDSTAGSDEQFAKYGKYALERDGYTEDVVDEEGIPRFDFLDAVDASSPTTRPLPSLSPPSRTREIRQQLQEDLNTVNAKIEGLFVGMSNHNYALHAVVCHSGSGRGGHYWVWIRDFEEGIWRKYNDTVVSEERDTRKLLDNLNSSGDPYFLCYVRAEDRAGYVRVPKREVPDLVLDL